MVPTVCGLLSPFIYILLLSLYPLSKSSRMCKKTIRLWLLILLSFLYSLEGSWLLSVPWVQHFRWFSSSHEGLITLYCSFSMITNRSFCTSSTLTNRLITVFYSPLVLDTWWPVPSAPSLPVVLVPSNQYRFSIYNTESFPTYCSNIVIFLHKRRG